MKNYYVNVHQKMDKMAKLIEENDKIVIFGHVNPDGDCIGTQLAFLRALKIKYPNKTIKAPFADKLEAFKFLLPKNYDGHITEADIKDALLIIPDMSTMDRIPFPVSKNAKIIKIDHHVKQEKFGLVSWIDDQAAATCVMIYFLFAYLKWPINSEIATALLTGIITDTGHFSVSSVKTRTFYAASKLMEKGAQLEAINTNLSCKRMSDLLVSRWVLEHFGQKDKVVYLKVLPKDVKMLKIKDISEIKEHINTFKGFKEIKIWIFCVQMSEKAKIVCEIRSTKIDIQKVAQKYGGGGHQNAAGASLKDWNTADCLINDLQKLAEANDLSE